MSLDYVTPTAQATREALTELTSPATSVVARRQAARRFRTIATCLPPTRRQALLEDVLDRIREYRLDLQACVLPADNLNGLLLARRALQS